VRAISRLPWAAWLLVACGDDGAASSASGTTGSTGALTGTTSTAASADTTAVGSSSSADDTTGGKLDDPQWPHLECDPLVPEHCGLPFPNNVFSVVDDATPTGRRLAFASAAMPRPNSGAMPDPAAFNERDGFSVSGTLLAYLPGATTTGFADPLHIGDSLSADSPTVLLDATTGERVAHFAELDVHADDDDRALMIQPAASLAYGHRYIVAVRGVVDAEGAPVSSSPAFAALRDGTASDEPSVEDRRALYGDIFARLAEVDVAREDLQLAWDFTVSSREHTNGRALHMRDVALEMVGDAGPNYTITSVDEDVSADIYRRIRGEIEVPLFLDDPGPGGVATVDADDVPQQSGTATYPFTILVPYSAQGEPGPSVAFGHGLFGSQSQVEAEEFQAFANEYGLVFIALDWIGMSEDDPTQVASLIGSGEIGGLRTIPDRLQQSLVNFTLAIRMMKTSIVDDPALEYMGQSMVDPDTAYYYGGSQGGIMGSCLMALTPDVERGVLGVPGQPYNLLLDRSVDFDPFFALAEATFMTAFDKQLLIGLMQTIWDRAEPSGYSVHVSKDPLPGTPAHDVLMLVAIGDHQVTTLGAHVMARSLGAVNLMPTNRSIWGIDEVRGPVTGSVMIEHDFGLPPEPVGNEPMREGDDPHGALAGVPTAAQTVEHFLRTGEARMFCDGVCDPD
jgi:hypothetical protein